jgi:hypothetical protein
MAIAFQKTVPILRILRVEKAKERVRVIDPLGNRIRFNEDLKPKTAT